MRNSSRIFAVITDFKFISFVSLVSLEIELRSVFKSSLRRFLVQENSFVFSFRPDFCIVKRLGGILSASEHAGPGDKPESRGT